MKIARENPLAPHLGVREARATYLDENGFTVEAYDEPYTKATFFALFDFWVPNTQHHRWGIMRHDLHHVATGFGTDMVGEGEISVWEFRRGLRGIGLYLQIIITTGVLAGFLLSPRRMLYVWRRAGRGPSLLGLEVDYDSLLDLDVGTLRDRLGLPRQGLCDGEAGLHARAPLRAREADATSAPR